MTKIDRVEQLPEWFDLQKYRECETFGAAQWERNLEDRAVVWNCIEIGEKYGLAELLPQEIEWVPLLLEKLRATPIESEAVRGSKPIRALHYDDIGHKLYDDSKDETLRTCWERLSSDPLGDSDNCRWSPIGTITTLFESGYPIMVDLRATDSVLTAAFSEWLKEARLNQPSSASKRERPAYQDWARYGLLPYLDLLIWAKETRHSISHQVMSEAVGYRKGGDSFRKTVPKLAAALMHSLAELEALASMEATSEQPGVRVTPEQLMT